MLWLNKLHLLSSINHRVGYVGLSGRRSHKNDKEIPFFLPVKPTEAAGIVSNLAAMLG